MNVTNAVSISEITGTQDYMKWKSTRVVLFTEQIRFPFDPRAGLCKNLAYRWQADTRGRALQTSKVNRPTGVSFFAGASTETCDFSIG